MAEGTEATRRPPPSPGTAVVHVRFFGVFREMAGASERRVPVSEGTTVGELVATLRGPGGLSGLPPDPAVAVNLEYAAADRVLEADDEIALIPPVAGG